MTETLARNRVTDDAVEIVPPEGYRSPAWHAARRNCVSASEIAAVIGLPSAYGSAFDLWWSKRLGDRTDDNEAMSRGRRCEPLVLEDFETSHPEFALRHVGLVQNVHRPYQVATPDALAYEGFPDGRRPGEGYGVGSPVQFMASHEPVGVVEAKTSGGRHGWGDEDTDEIPPEYLAQVRWQLDTLGLRSAWVPVWFGFDYRCYFVEQDDDDAAFMRDRALAFLHSLEADTPPPIDSHTATSRRLKRMHPSVDAGERVELPEALLRQYVKARTFRDRAADRLALHENRIRDLMGAAQYGDLDGARWVSRSVYEVGEHVRAPYTVDRLNVNPPKPKKSTKKGVRNGARKK